MRIPDVLPNIGWRNSPCSSTSSSSNCSAGLFFLPFSHGQPSEWRRKPTVFGNTNSTLWPLDSGAQTVKWWESSLFIYSLRPCLPPPLTPLFLLLLACCRFGAGGLSCIFHRGIGNCFATDHPDVGGQAPHTGQRKFSTVYKNPSVLMSRGRPLSGFWRRLAIGLWKSQQKRENGTKAEERHPQGPSQDKASLLMGFNALRQELAARKKENGVEEMPSQEDDAQMTTLKVKSTYMEMLEAVPHFSGKSFLT